MTKLGLKTSPDFKIKFGKKGVVAVYKANMSEESADMLDAAYEVLGLRNAVWIREVVTRDVQIIIFPSNRLPIDSSSEEGAPIPPFF
jgi:hypothetical protein